MARNFGMTHFVNPKRVGDDLVAHLIDLTGGGADYSSSASVMSTRCGRRWNAP